MKQALLTLVSVFLAAAPSAQAGSVAVPGAAGGNFSVRVESMHEAQYRTTIRQQYDYSCGSAALATLLTHHYRDKVTEQDVFDSMFDAGNQDKIRREGFSMLDMKRYLERRGYPSDGYKLDIDKFEALGIPAIVLINQRGYNHFVVVKGITSKEVLVGDPANGTKRVPRNEFVQMWKGLAFFIRSDRAIAQASYNLQREWRVRGRAPVDNMLTVNELANVTWLLPQRNDY